ncbi:hypothetical protein C2845_PM02G13240 [Panicum miliaceum]|uniref:Uncharacterized protein n=1 Tax=Panicum miliaceum TaxID=4540 RepID=A0A3L6SCG2_PANMI|nr:hypothetical protein C2845_PM02G13240 [Panicum miliaceum]
MALRALVGKLRSPPARGAVSRAFSQTCKHCGKTSSRILISLGQKNEAIKDDYSVRYKRFQRKQYMIRATTAVTSLTLSWLAVRAGIAYLEDDENYRSRK